MSGPEGGGPVVTEGDHRKKPGENGKIEDCIDLRLYVTNETPNCLAAFANIKQICEERFEGRYRITVIDLVKNPRLARQDNILAIPTLIRVPQGHKRRKVIGTLSDVAGVLKGLGLPDRNGITGNNIPENGPGTAVR